MTSRLDHRPVVILVVEDDVLVRMIATDILSEAGFRTIEAHDAQEALALLAARTDVRVLFTDWNMPGDTDGVGLAHLVHSRWPDIGIIVTSGKMQPAPGELPAGARFIAKPFQPSVLILKVQDLLQKVRDKAAQSIPVLPAGTIMQSPVTGAMGGEIAGPVQEPDKS